jgi:hypothetical protein
MSKPLNRKQKDACTSASEAISNLEFLQKRPEFIAFMDRLRRQADGFAEQVLHEESISDKEREQLRLKRLGILECLKAPSDDITAQKKVLRDHGMSVEG